MNTRCAAVSGWRRRGEQHVATCGRANRAFDRRSGCFRVRSSLFAPASNHRALLRALSQTALDGPSPCQLPLHCHRQIALPVAVAGSVGPFVCCCWMGDRRRHPRGWPELPVRAAAIDRAQVCRRPRWSVAAVPAAAAACLPSFLPLSAPPLLRPWLPLSLLLPPRPARWHTHCSSGAGTGALARRVTSMRTSHTCEVAGLCCCSTRAHATAETTRESESARTS